MLKAFEPKIKGVLRSHKRYARVSTSISMLIDLFMDCPPFRIALPSFTFTKEVIFHLDDEEIRVIHFTGHTDGDAVIWFTKAKVRPKCSKCNSTQPRIKLEANASNVEANASISDDIMHGNIFTALNKADLDIMNDKQLQKDLIPIILQRDDIKYAFAKACEEKNRSPSILMRRAVRFWLKSEGYL